MNRAESIAAIRPYLKHQTALIGGGGKTTLLYALGQALARDGARVLLTTTTHLAHDPAAVAPETPAQLNAMLVPGQAALAAYPAAQGRMTGIPPEWYPGLRADRILVEADGSRGMPLKFHRDHEPVVPAGTQLVLQVAGLGALGRTVESAVHGWEHAGLDPQAPVTEDLIARLLIRGAALAAPADCIAILNQADTPELERRGGRIAARLREAGIRSLVTCMNESIETEVERCVF